MGVMACTTCRMIRRFLIAFGVGGYAAWQITAGALPNDAASQEVWRGALWVAIVIAGLNVFMRMRQMRSRWRQ